MAIQLTAFSDDPFGVGVFERMEAEEQFELKQPNRTKRDHSA